MQCPNCKAQIFEGDRFCGECGTDVSKITGYEPDNGHIKMVSDTNQQGKAGTSAPNSNTYFKTVLSFIKNSFLRPGRMIGADKIYAPSVTSGTVGMAAVIVSLLFFIMGRSLAGPYTSVPFSVLFRIFFVLAVLIAIYYGVTMLMNVLLLKNAKSWQQILHDFSVSTTIVLGLFVVAIGFSAITLVEIGMLFWVVGSLLFITAPIYIFLKYAQNHKVKFDSYYSLIIYFIINAIIYYILVRIAIAQSLYYMEDLFMF